MAATFSFAQLTGSVGNATTPANSASPGLTPTSSAAAMSWDYETGDNTGTLLYTANPVSAGSASYPVWLKFYFTNTVAYTVNNFKFWQFQPAASAGATASFTTFGQTVGAYSIASSTATGAVYASNASVATNGVNSTASPAGALTGFGTFGSSAGNSGLVGGNGATGTFLCLQLSAAAAAAAGTTGYFGYTVQYDET